MAVRRQIGFPSHVGTDGVGEGESTAPANLPRIPPRERSIGPRSRRLGGRWPCISRARSGLGTGEFFHLRRGAGVAQIGQLGG